VSALRQRVARARWQPWVTLLARLVLAGVMFAASIPKLLDVDASAKAIYAYQLLPTGAADLVAYTLPVVELLLGIALLLGIFVRPVAVVYVLLMAVFVAGIASVWSRGLKIDCGCFGGGGETEDPRYLQEILRDTGLALLATWVYVFPRSRFAVGAAETPDLDDAEVEPVHLGAGGGRRP
jgi:uncharacterized membrane protein YphA (DoxX/SURF4 family)